MKYHTFLIEIIDDRKVDKNKLKTMLNNEMMIKINHIK